MAMYLGIDGGATKTTCAVGDECRLLGVGTAGPSNVLRVGEEEARRSLHQAIGAACKEAGISPAAVQSASIGVAGAGVEEVRNAVQRLVSEIISGHIEVVGDMVVAMEGAFAGGPGVIVMAGTGSIAFGRNPQGEKARAGGWGWAISDEGSGQWIGRRAVNAALRASDRGKSPALLPAIMSAWQLSSRDELVRAANATPQPNFAALFPCVLKVARSGDVLAGRVLNDAGEELAQLGAVVIERLWRDASGVRVALGGGVLRNGALVRHAFFHHLRRWHPGVSVSFKIVDPVAGALFLARRQFYSGARL